MKAYKGFNADWTCAGGSTPFQYEVGKTYVHDGRVSLCHSGFHACENPLDTFSYYKPGESQYAAVDLDATDEKSNDDSKRVGRQITIEASLSIADIVKAAVKFISSRCDPSDANAATTGYMANAATAGEGANAATTGEGANAATTGNRANAATTGNRANAATTGEGANAATAGKNSIAAALGINSRVKAGEGGALVARWTDDDGRPRISVGYVGEGFDAGIWYRCNERGELVKVDA